MRRITDGPGNEARPSFSADGKWIYFRSDRGGNDEIWRMPSAGGPAQQVTHQGAHEPFESSDGQWLYFIKRVASPELFRIPASGNGEEQLAISEPGLRAWAVGGNNLYLGVGGPGEATRIERFSPATHQKEEIYRFPVKPQVLTRNEHALAVSRDERTIIAAFIAPVSVDIVLVENFR